MPTQHFKMPFALPFKFVPVENTGRHFDDCWAYLRTRDFQIDARYKQKWQLSDVTKLQMESSIAPQDLQVLRLDGSVITSFIWNIVVGGINYKIYETEVDLSAIPEDIYFLHQQVNFMDIDWRVISEPIHLKETWPNTMFINYKNSYNDNDIAWTTGINMGFRCECGIMNLEPKRNNTDYINQENRARLLKGRPYREFKLLVGNAAGVGEWVADLLNVIMCCDYTTYDDKRYIAKPGSDLEIRRALGYPLIGVTQDLLEWENRRSLELNNTAEIAPGIVTAYSIETGFFGPGTEVPITEVQENS